MSGTAQRCTAGLVRGAQHATPRRARGIAGLLVCMMFVSIAGAGVSRVQTIELEPGWNAVYLTVAPEVTDPEALFDGIPVDLAASCFASRSSAQFMTDPGVNMLQSAGWGVWYAPTRADAFLSNLDAIYGQRAYLLHARTNVTWEVRGAVERFGITWRPDAYNLVGFTLSPAAPPTFRQFFAGASALPDDRIYRLVNGSWRHVAAPDAAPMRAGEAFWVYCADASRYQGPLRVETEISHGLILRSEPSSFVLRNTTDHPLTVTLQHVPESAGEAVPLSILIRVVGDTRAPLRTVPLEFGAGAWSHTLPPLEAGRSIRIPVEARLEEMTRPVHSSLLKITTDLGTEDWIPVFATREDKREQ